MIDFEGTLTDNRWRLHLIQDGHSDWKEYYAGLEKDEAIEHVKDMVILLKATNREVLLYTTRMPNKHNLEQKWLIEQNMIGYTLLMRENTKVPGPQLLKSWVEQYKPYVVIDDRAENRAAVETMCIVYSPDDLLEEDG